MVSPHQPNDLWIRGFGSPPDRANGIAGGGRPRLLCFPHAGGSASFYRPLSQQVGGAAEVLAVQYPGRQDRRAEPPVPTIEGLVDLIFDQLKGFADQPLALFGHSMGAVIAYEIGRRLERDTETPLLGLIASGRRAPSVHIDENVHRRGDRQLVADVRELSGTDASLLDDEDVLAMILPALRADYRAIENYRHRPGRELACPILTLVGEEDPRAPLDQAQAWQRHTTAAFDLRVFKGGHFYLSEQWPVVGDTVRGGLAAFARHQTVRPPDPGA